MQWIVGLVFAAGIGLSLGLMGGGGSVLALPVLVYVMGVSPKPAIAMTLVIVGTVSLLGLIPHWRAGNVNLKTALVFGSATMVGTFAGAKIATLPVVSETFQMLLFAVVMLLAAGFMIYRSARPTQPENPLALYPKPVCQYCWLWLLSEGLGVGLLTGLVGVGGGFAIVPALVLLAKLPMKQAIGTSLLIIIANSVTGFLGYWGHVDLDWHLMVSFIFVASLGTIPGAYLARYVPAQRLQTIFGVFLLAVATFVLVQNRQSLQLSRPSGDAVAQGVESRSR
ncbi:sulfite exporter TauE/SafE family protein [Nodosilinea sp. LEGE 07298]|uniref:sulfite exporter TauE/SafE family protein n=1 Tax=Nodosilinea sp. LEGE 07298 TaxID=2777970 RepID=UPI0018815F46|nr:sulfite exporter TauE/SafE family protein [Nodosilinea sp. LEGE 07298]MBE9109730.1 sulfite exporter TauE/SafE family protein [Nodosilinea sp. LEGE 07298]